MDFPIIAAVLGVLSIGVLFLLARRALRFIVRLALVGVLILFLLIGGVTWWWYGSDDSSTQKGNSRPAKTGRSTSR
jgi:multisubunit Na+/H+ antiporter MnhC subunit